MEMLKNMTLPPEIIEEILSWLPVKSICRFRCVSKAWKALFSEPEFIKTHLRRSKQLQRESVFFCSESGSLFSADLSNVHHLLDNMTALALKKLSYPGCSSPPYTFIVASCDGLVLVVEDADYLLINPTTREINEVYPCYEMKMWGLGYDVVSDDYKIIAHALDHHEPDVPNDVFLYSVKNGTWKLLEVSPTSDPDEYGVFLHGYIHWLAGTSIGAFDLAEEKFCEVPSPSLVGNYDDSWSNSLVVLGGCLCLIYKGPRETDIWMMKEYGVKESWTKFTIVLPETNEFTYLCMLGHEQMLLLEDKQKPEWRADKLLKGITFVESLISPCCRNEKGADNYPQLSSWMAYVSPDSRLSRRVLQILVLLFSQRLFLL